ncbi:UDP-glycosyltransferase UGT5-like [Euwallacea similis]|uniref:UDP-glycosyltransferase UGT5-like n=1 Tax=Euwallacea similis TaxID=1736056 RepID=UPI00344DB829
MTLLILLVIKCVLILGTSNAAKILGIFTFPAGSHNILATKLLAGLAEDGHEITFIAPYPTKNIPKNTSWNEIVLDGLKEEHYSYFNQIDMYEDSNLGLLDKMHLYQNLMTCWVNITMFHPKMRALMASNNKFDVVIMEDFFNLAHKYYAHYYDCPLILLSTMGPTSFVANLLRNPLPPTYVPHTMLSHAFDFHNYWHRLTNIVSICFIDIVEYFVTISFHTRLLEAAFPDSPPLEELNKRVALVLLNTHESLMQPIPLVPSMVNVGGYHVDTPKDLPQDLQKFMDSAKEGVIYFSMGSNLKAKDMSEEKKQIFFNVFKRLKQKILWKFEDKNVTGLPKNVFIKSWMPQQDILAHPNVKLFITHGGLLSTTEAIHHGVPMLTIPVFADQFTNAATAVRGGYGLRISYNDANFNEDTLNNLIDQLLIDPKYRENVKHRSKFYNDRPMKPMETLVYWVNYVIRHKGAEHLKVAGVHLREYQYLMLDIFIPFIILMHVGFYLWFRVVRYIYRRFSNKKSSKVSKKQKIQ